MITETRKSIIELIEPYMNKELEFWCLYKDIYNDFEIIDRSSRIEIIQENIKLWSCIIFWHYDMSSIHIFLKKTTWSYYWLDFDIINGKEYLVFINWSTKKNKWKIPNKPLYLFTEKEDENLLKILHKFNNY